MAVRAAVVVAQCGSLGREQAQGAERQRGWQRTERANKLPGSHYSAFLRFFPQCSDGTLSKV